MPLTCASCGSPIPGSPGMVNLACPACGTPVVQPPGGGGPQPPTTQPCCPAEPTPSIQPNYWNRLIPAAGMVNPVVASNPKRLEVKISNMGSGLVFLMTSHLLGGLGVGYGISPGEVFREERYKGDIFLSAQVDNTPVSIAEYYSV